MKMTNLLQLHPNLLTRRVRDHYKTLIPHSYVSSVDGLPVALGRRLYGIPISVIKELYKDFNFDEFFYAGNPFLKIAKKPYDQD